MLRSTHWAFWAATLVAWSTSAAAQPDDQLTVMTYNLRYASPQGENNWPARRPVAKALIESAAPDLIGTQEGLYGQLRDLEADLPDYAWLGLGREGGSRGEFMAIFYRRDRWDPLEYDHYWLSDTPERIGSATWGNTVRRMVTWVRFRRLPEGPSLYFVNTHFDHQVQASREKSAELLLNRSGQLASELPVVLVGDFNAAAGANPAYDTLLASPAAGGAAFRDAWLEAPQRGPDVGTFHNYRGPRPGPRIDWILLRGPVQALSAEVLTFEQAGQYPSDHFPVLARLKLTQP